MEDGEEIRTLEAPLQPGNVTATTSDGLLGVIGVRGLPLEVYDARTLESSGHVDAGEGPTHVVPGPDDDRFLVYEARPEPGRVASAPLPGGSPYGLAMDPERAQLRVTLTAEKYILVRFDIRRDAARDGPLSHRRPPAHVAGSADRELRILDPR